MNFELSEVQEFMSKFNPSVSNDSQTILCVPFIYLHRLIDTYPAILFGAQDVSSYSSGAHTGEVSSKMLQSIGVRYAIVGHSERRSYFKESNELLIAKINQLLDNGIKPIFCVGEPLSVREKNQHHQLIEEQINQVVSTFTAENIQQWIIAYEPVWAIGTGKTATPTEAHNMHKFIRNLFAKKYDTTIANQLSILYGGSVKPDNANDLFSCEDIDGALVGGASLDPISFEQIIDALQKD